MDWRFFKNKLKKFKYWPLHPQWLVFRNYKVELQQIATQVQGQRVLDIGCGEQDIREYLSENTEYWGLDYYKTATQWYNTKPQVFGNAQSLPFGDDSMDAVLLLDVLEHLPDPDACLCEIARVLRPGGCCILQVPFLYPIHDAPLDFQRWTRYGLHKAVLRNGFSVHKISQIGKPIETATLLLNIAVCKTFLNWVEHRNPALFLGILLPLLIPLLNILALLVGKLSPEDVMMPYRYLFILQENSDLLQIADD